MLQVWLLGQFEIKLEGRRVVLATRAAQSLFAYLILSAGTPHRREKLAGMFWSELPEQNARRNLRNEVWRIRKALIAPNAPAREYILADEITLAFNPHAEYWLDAAQLQSADTEIESLISNLFLYRGELLPGLYDDWVSLERERLQAVYENKMQTLLQTLIAAERWNTTLEWSERWIAQGQTPEPAYRALMVAHGALGNLSQVALDYQRCVEAMRADIGVEPSSETRALFEKLTRGERGETQIAAPLPTVFVQSAGTITFLFSDIEGSTKLLEKLGDEYAVLLSDQRDVLRGVAENFSGYEVDTQGDSFFFAFFRAADAVNFATAAQRALAAHTWPHDATLRVRMGLHTGEPMLARTGYVGMDVHRAARIGASGHGGQVLLSQTTSALIENQLPEGTMLKDLGEHQLKDLRYPVHIIQLSIEGLPADFPPLKAISSGIEPPAPGEPPFKGLEFFDERDANLFFGREELTTKLVDTLRANKFLAVVIGASGSGKSSLVRAGVVPALRRGGDVPPERLYENIFILTPTAHPLDALAITLTRDFESVTAPATLIDDLKQDPRALYLFLRRQFANRESPIANRGSVAIGDKPYAIRHTLLVIDQFEELFTLCRDEFERETFIDNLLTALSYGDDGNLTVMLTLRADFYAHLAQYPELRDAVAKHQEFIGPMTSEELRRAMEEPAKKEGWSFEPGLVDLILRDVGDEPGALPLLSHALLETWKRRSGHTLTLKGYHDAGGVRGAIAQTAESAYQQFTPDEQIIARDIFLRLTELGDGTEDTRRRASFDELIPRDENAATTRAILTRLADARLITLHQDNAEVAHEALIREWARLREWLNQDREGLRLHRQITEAAQEWDELEHDTGALYRGARLIQGRDFAEQNPYALNESERAFLRASDENEIKELREKEEQQKRELEQAQRVAEAERQRAEEQQRGAKRLRWFAAGLALFLVVALAAAYFAFNQSNVAQENFIKAEEIRLASQADAALGNGEGGDLPALLSLQSLKYGYSPQADASLLNSLKRGFTKQLYAGNTDMVWSASISPDGRKLATGGADGTMRVYDAITGKELAHYTPATGCCNQANFTPDGRYVILGGANMMHLWDTVTNEPVRQYTGLAGGAWGYDISSDGKYVVTADDAGAKLFDIQTGALVFTYTLPYSTPAIFSPDGHFIIISSADNIARLIDVSTGKELQQFESDAFVPWLAYSPDGKYVLTMAGDNAQLWDAATGEKKQRYLGHVGLVLSGGFSPDGKYVATGGADKTARIWETETGREVQTLTGHTGRILWVEFSSDGRYLATGSEDRTARLWDLQAEREPRRIFTYNKEIWGSVPNALSPDSNMLLYDFDRANNAGWIWNPETGDKHLVQFEELTSFTHFHTFAFSPDNQYLAGGQENGTVWVWDTQTGARIHKLEGHNALMWSVLFSPDGRLIASGGDDKTARIWDTQSGKELQQLLGHTASVRDVAFSPDSKFVLTGSDDKTARLWDARTGKEIKQFLGHSAPVRAVAFSPDGKFIVTGSDDETARMWDVETGKELRQLLGHAASVSQVAFSPDGQLVLTGSQDQTARLWNAQTGQILREFPGHASQLLFSGFADNGRTIITGDLEAIYHWRANLGDVLAFTCSQLTRDLMDDERALYGIKDTAATCAK